MPTGFRRNRIDQITGMSDPSQIDDLHLRMEVQEIQENIRALAAQQQTVQQQVESVDEYDDTALRGLLKKLDIKTRQIEGDVFINASDIETLFGYWENWDVAFRIRFMNGHPIQGSGDIRIAGGFIQMDGRARYVAEIEDITPGDFDDQLIYVKGVQSPTTGAWTLTAHSQDFTTYPWFPPEYDYSTGYYQRVIGRLHREAGGSVFTLTQLHMGVIIWDSMDYDFAVSFNSATTVHVAAGTYYGPGTYATSTATTKTISQESWVYLKVLPSGLAAYTLSIEVNASLPPDQVEGEDRIPLACVKWDNTNGRITEIHRVTRKGPQYLRGCVP